MKLNPLSWFRNADTTYSVSDDAVLQAFLGALSAVSASGVRVDRNSVLRSTAALACLIVRSETHSSLPVDVKRGAGRYRIDALEDPVYRLLSIAPNELMNAGEFWRWEDLHEDVNGNAYARIVWKGYDAVEIWPLVGAKPEFYYDRTSRTAAYRYQGDDFTPADAYPAKEILHFKGSVLRSPTEGASLVDLASEAIGVSIASEQFFARLLSNGNHFPGYLETDATLKREDVQTIADQLKGFGGVLQTGVMRIFDRGLKYKSNPMSVKDADLTEQMRWQLQQICSVFRVPLAMVQDLTHGTYTNSEQQDLWLAKHTVGPMCVNKERVVRHRLFVNRPDHYMKFNINGLLRGDFKTRMEGYAAGINSGYLVRNEARELEDMNPYPGLDAPVLNLGYGTVEKDGSVTPSKERAPSAILEPVLRDAAACIRRRAQSDEKRGRSRDETIAFASEKLAPIAEAYLSAGLAWDADSFIAHALGDGATTLPVEGTEALL